jgi:hypothetical protein
MRRWRLSLVALLAVSVVTLLPAGAEASVPPPPSTSCGNIFFTLHGMTGQAWMTVCLKPDPASGPHEMIATVTWGSSQRDGNWQRCNITLHIINVATGARLGGSRSKDCGFAFANGSSDTLGLPPILGAPGARYQAFSGVDCTYNGDVQACKAVARFSPPLTLPN